MDCGPGPIEEFNRLCFLNSQRIECLQTLSFYTGISTVSQFIEESKIATVCGLTQLYNACLQGLLPIQLTFRFILKSQLCIAIYMQISVACNLENWLKCL